MATKTKDDEPPKRLNRVVGAGEALNKVLDPAFRKRGFAARDVVMHWAAMAPAPYDRVAAPDKLVWPRGERNAGGAVLYLRCAPGHALALNHEGAKVAAAVNRYFGYVIVASVRLSAEPFVPREQRVEAVDKSTLPADPVIDAAVGTVADDGLRDALRRLGRGIKGKTSS
ncbi:MAG TPA: DciA family protein [Devosia sp.]|nr:DciA family protein [Devosia sp.]